MAHNIMCMHVGMELVRQRFAVVDISDNYSFNFVSGVSDNDIFPQAGIN